MGEIQNFYCYPAPCPDFSINLHYTLTRNADSAHVELFNRNRAFIRREELPIFSGANIVSFELVDGTGNELANGLYYLRIKVRSIDNAQVSSISRFVKVR
jgi:hypothetical protein